VYKRHYSRGGTSARLRAHEARHIAERDFANANRESIIDGTLAAHGLRSGLVSASPAHRRGAITPPSIRFRGPRGHNTRVTIVHEGLLTPVLTNEGLLAFANAL
jgi:hypothetical protein